MQMRARDAIPVRKVFKTVDFMVGTPSTTTIGRAGVVLPAILL
jgi:hypothetical protein